jgi:CubicO group peptidase (beta-lactamase class C family)
MKLIHIVLATSILTGCASAPPRPTNVLPGDYSSTKEYAGKLIQYEMKKNAVTGLSIALVDDQHIVWSEGFGYADQEHKIPATAETLYRVASISKLFTDTAAMQLQEQGKLDIDQPLRKYIPDFSIKTRFPDIPEITPRMLMTHHSGLPRDHLKGFMTPHPEPFTGLVKEIRNAYTNYPPNLVFSYSNLGITLLGGVIQNQSGVPFADYMKQSVLTPLGMTNSKFENGLSASPLMAKGYQGREAAIEPPLRDTPAGGLNSSVTDMSHFMSMIFAGGTSGKQQILKTSTINEMLRPQNTDVPLDFDFHIGLGWPLSTFGGSKIENAGTVAHHSGATYLFRSQMYILPDHKLGVVVLSNSSTAGGVVDHVAKETLMLALQAKAGIVQPKPEKHFQTDNTPLTTEKLREYIGYYATIIGFARVYAKGNELRAEAAGRDFGLLRGSDGLFRLDYKVLGMFHINLGPLGEIGLSRQKIADRELLVAHAGSQKMLAGQRIYPPKNITEWQQYLGSYEISNLGNDFKNIDHINLVEDHGFLLAEFIPTLNPKEKSRIPLQLVSATEAFMLGNLADGGSTLRVIKIDGENQLQVFGYTLKKIAP